MLRVSTLMKMAVLLKAMYGFTILLHQNPNGVLHNGVSFSPSHPCPLSSFLDPTGTSS